MNEYGCRLRCLIFLPDKENFMNIWKRCAALLLALTMIIGLTTGCGEEATADSLALSVCLGDGLDTFDPIYATEIEDMTVVSHLYENLMRVKTDAAGETVVVPGMAKSYEQELNHDGTVTWTFKLESARWSDGKEVKADDFVYAWRRLANPASGSPFANLLSIVAGYDEVRATGDTSLLQVAAKNDSTLEVVLRGNFDWFLTDVCTAPATSPLREDVVTSLRDAAVERNKLRETATGTAGTEKWWTKTENLVTNGPYVIGEYDEAVSLVLQPASRYHGGENGPVQLIFRFADTAKKAQALYDEGDVDFVTPLTDEKMTEKMSAEDWLPVYELHTYAAVFNCDREPFTDPLVRQAMVLAIDRAAIAQAVGITATAAAGLVPPGVPGNEEGDFRTISAVELDNDPETYAERCAQAQALLAEAGYDSGAYLGEIPLHYLDTPAHHAAAQLLAQQWQEVLRVQVIPTPLEIADMRALVRSGDYSLLGMSLRAVGNDAECFLMQFTTDSESNLANYGNSAYDTLTSIIAGAAGGTARTGCLQDAEVLLMADNAIAPLYNTVTDWTVREHLAGICRDARGWFWLGDVCAQVED